MSDWDEFLKDNPKPGGWGSGWGQKAADKALEILSNTEPKAKDFFSNSNVVSQPDGLIEQPEYSLDIKSDDEIKTVTGMRVGWLLVHPSLSDWGFSISHIPSRVSFMKAVPPGSYSDVQLIEWCRMVQRGFPDEWRRLSTLTINDYDSDNHLVQKAKDRVQAFCLQTPVV